MGCDLCIYVPDTGKDDCAMAYSSFHMIRIECAKKYMEINELDTDGLLGFEYDTMLDMIKSYLHTHDDEDGEILARFMEHCDCEGIYYTDECADNANFLTKYLDNYFKDDGDEFFICKVKSLRDTFKAAAEQDGVVIVY